MSDYPQPLALFYSYSHKDEIYREKLEEALALLKRQGHIKPWTDRNITAGSDWRGQIDQNLEAADIVLLLVSASFIASDYCYDVEMKRALERDGQGARVIPILLKPCEWRETPLKNLQALPKDGKPVVDWPTADHAFDDIAKGLRRVIEEIRNPTPAPPPTGSGRG